MKKSKESILKKFWKLLTKKRVIEKIIKLDESKMKPIEQYEHILKERAQMQGTILAREKQLRELNEENKQLKDDLNRGEKEKDVIARKLTEKYLKASVEHLKGAFSLTKLFAEKLRDNNFEVFSYNMKKSFGKFDDIIFLEDGRIGVSVIDGKDKKRKVVLTGDNLKHIFRNFSGMAKTADRGYLILNLNEEGDYMENILEEDVPKIIIDSNGGINVSSVDKMKFADALVSIEEEKQELYHKVSELEGTLNKILTEHRINELNLKIMENRALSSETSLSDVLTKVIQIQKVYNDLIKLIDSRALDIDIKESKLDALGKSINEVMLKVETTEGKSEREKSKEDFKKDLEWAKEVVVKPEIIIPQAEEKDVLEKKFEHATGEMELKKKIK